MILPEVTANLSHELIEDVEASVYRVPTASPESDATLEWDHTDVVVVRIKAAGKIGLGVTYACPAVAYFIRDHLSEMLISQSFLHPEIMTGKMIASVRNQGTCGITMMAISAVDIALWDLLAKIFNLPLYQLLGRKREQMPLYGSGGFTSYELSKLTDHMVDWLDYGVSAVKMKVGRNKRSDFDRIEAVLSELPEDRALYIDGNGGFYPKEALAMADYFSDGRITWFEEPVTTDYLEQLITIKTNLPPAMRLACGEYGYIPSYYNRILERKACDVIQADLTRCGGVTGFMRVGHLCAQMNVQFSSHCAPLWHLHPALSLEKFSEGELFFDHMRIESELFLSDAVIRDGMYQPSDAPGHGIRINKYTSEKYLLSGKNMTIQ